MNAGIGHNNGPELDGEFAWRRFAWKTAREQLVPTLPVEVVRLRVRRAAELGLDYRTYAGVRASTGRDVIGFLFSTNALALLRRGDRVPAAVAAQVGAITGADRSAVAQPPLDAAALLAQAPFDAAFAAPPATLSWPQMRDAVQGMIRARGLPADGVIVIGETALEREWAEAGRTAGFLTGSRYFGTITA